MDFFFFERVRAEIARFENCAFHIGLVLDRTGT